MQDCEVLIIGGGPAGSSCAWQLARNGVDCIVLDRQTFPRLKLCAGWVTPEVLEDLETSKEEYQNSGNGFVTFDKDNPIIVHLGKLKFSLKTVQHSVRRYEFDDWLLKRSQAPVHEHYAKNVRQENGYYIVDEQYRSKYLVGAGGTKCPVYRSLFRDINPRARELQAVTLEEEFPYDWKDSRCHLWFFQKGLPGYSWYVPKGNSHVNVGIGGMAYKLKQQHDDIGNYWKYFQDTLGTGFIAGHEYKRKGYSYYLRTDVTNVRMDNAFITGDSIGLATRDLCEGIGPAVKSGIRAADAIMNTSTVYSVADIEQFTNDNWLSRSLLEYMFIKRKVKSIPSPQPAQ